MVKITGNEHVKIYVKQGLADAKVSARQQCVHECPYSENIYGKSTQRNIILKSTFNRSQLCRY